jgi:U3 small nucleolar RNA-associated protein 20
LEVCVSDLFGNISEEKEVQNITRKLKEAKKCRSYETLYILSSHCSVKYFCALLKPFKQIMSTTDSPKSIKKVEKVLETIASGICSNETLKLEDVMIFSYDLIHENLALSKAGKKYIKTKTLQEVTAHVHHVARQDAKTPRCCFQTHAHMFIELGLTILNYLCKKHKIEKKNPRHLGLLDPFISKLCDTLLSKYDKIILLSLKILSFTFQYNLPSLSEHVLLIEERVFKLLRKTGGGTACKELPQACFKLITTIIRDYSDFNISAEHIEILLLIAKAGLEEAVPQSCTFTFLNFIIKHKLSLPIVYDIMDIVLELAIKSDLPITRRACRNIFIAYIVAYPISEKRLDKHMHYIVENLKYEQKSGREVFYILLMCRFLLAIIFVLIESRFLYL